MKLSEFAYHLPEELIAQQPLKRRDYARLMVVDRRTKKIYHDRFYNIGKYLPEKSVLVVNSSKVMPVRLLGQKQTTGGKVEVFLLKGLKDRYCRVLMRPLKRLKIGDKIVFKGSSIYAHVVDIKKRIVKFNCKNVFRKLDTIGHMPLPPYIRRSDTKADRQFYQTVYARFPGSVAAPTAGLHFTKPLLKRIQTGGHTLKHVMLHINYATFKPVEENDIRKHPMHGEEYSISAKTFQEIGDAKVKGRKIVAVGTTSCRVLEAVAKTKKLKGQTNLFIYPGYKFKMVDALITNFHFPFSTLLMLVYAFGTKALMRRAYQEAIKEKYRFFSYGDGMLII